MPSRATRKFAWSSSPPTGKGFCAGHDLKEIRALKELPKIEQLFAQCSRMMQTITALPQPVIARVQGVAAAAGCQLVAQCDLAVAAEARQVRHAAASPGASSARRPASRSAATCQRKHAMEMLLTGELDRCAQGHRMGPGQPVCPGTSLEESDGSWPGKSPRSRRPPSLPASARFYQQMDLGLAKAYELASRRHLRELRPRRGPRRHGRLHREAPAARRK